MASEQKKKETLLQLFRFICQEDGRSWATHAEDNKCMKKQKKRKR